MSLEEKITNPFQVLIGEQLGSVVFVQDYLQLDFDGSILTCFRWPEVIHEYSTSKFGDDQYRNELCTLIAKEVLNTTFVEEIILEIHFQNGSRIRLSLVPNSDSKEIGHFKDAKDNWSFL